MSENEKTENVSTETPKIPMTDAQWIEKTVSEADKVSNADEKVSSADQSTTVEESKVSNADEKVSDLPADNEEFPSLDAEQIAKLREYIGMIGKGSRVSAKAFVRKKDNREFLQMRGKGGNKQVADQDLWPYLQEEYHKLLDEKGPDFFKDDDDEPNQQVADSSNPNIPLQVTARKPVTLTPTQLTKDTVWPIAVSSNDTRPVLVQQMEWFAQYQRVINALGQATLFITFQVSKESPDQIMEVLAKFKNENDLIQYCQSYLGSLVKAHSMGTNIQKMEEKINAQNAELVMAEIAIERLEKERAAVVSQMQLLLASMSPQDIQRFMNARVISDIMTATGPNPLDIPNNGGLALPPPSQPQQPSGFWANRTQPSK